MSASNVIVIADGAASSSVSFRVASVTVTPASVPSRLIVSSGSSSVSSVGVSSKSTEPLSAPALIVMLWSATVA